MFHDGVLRVWKAPPDQLSWLEHGADNTTAVGQTPVGATHFRLGLNDPFGSLQTQNIRRSLHFFFIQAQFLPNHVQGLGTTAPTLQHLM